MTPWKTMREMKGWADLQVGSALCVRLGLHLQVTWHYERISGLSTGCTLLDRKEPNRDYELDWIPR